MWTRDARTFIYFSSPVRKQSTGNSGLALYASLGKLTVCIEKWLYRFSEKTSHPKNYVGNAISCIVLEVGLLASVTHSFS